MLMMVALVGVLVLAVAALSYRLWKLRQVGGTAAILRVHSSNFRLVGFTTDPSDSRSTPYCTDIGKMVQAPIFHVNGDDPEAVVYVCKLAAEFRQEFKRDVVVDIFCYRKYGHNESDEPMFTQPIMYREISKKPLPAKLYSDKLVAEGTLSQDEVDGKFAEFRKFFDEQYEVAKNFKPNKADWLEGEWAGLSKPDGDHPDGGDREPGIIRRQDALVPADHSSRPVGPRQRLRAPARDRPA